MIENHKDHHFYELVAHVLRYINVTDIEKDHQTFDELIRNPVFFDSDIYLNQHYTYLTG